VANALAWGWITPEETSSAITPGGAGDEPAFLVELQCQLLPFEALRSEGGSLRDVGLFSAG